jgi:ATP-dependent Clp protease ATP-binding subunit ClpB
MEVMRAHFRPEFLNRVDEIILFHSLSPEQLNAIVDIQLKRLEKRMADQRITLTLTPPAKSLLAKLGYDPQYGARPLKRVIQREVLDALSLQILEGTFKENDAIMAEVDKKDPEKLAFRKGK